jgi:cyclic pyranopterin phosphate synthase
MSLTDPHGRGIRKLRLQLTDACNFRCFYCMPEGTRFKPARDLLSPGEIAGICRSLHGLGIEEIRVTGGEPTVRPEFDAIMARLADIPWKKFGITSNGYLLGPKLRMLKELGCRHVNISLDSLDPDRFRSITGSARFADVRDTILSARELGLDVKVNMIVFRGKNDDEVPAFARFSAAHGVEVRFLELMKVGPADARHPDLFVPAEEMLARLRETEELIPVDVPIDSTAFAYRTASGARLGFIASESKPFCGACSRLRLSATGRLRACLFSEAGVELRGQDVSGYPDILGRVMALKPTGRLPRILQPMNQIGG